MNNVPVTIIVLTVMMMLMMLLAVSSAASATSTTAATTTAPPVTTTATTTATTTTTTTVAPRTRTKTHVETQTQNETKTIELSETGMTHTISPDESATADTSSRTVTFPTETATNESTNTITASAATDSRSSTLSNESTLSLTLSAPTVSTTNTAPSESMTRESRTTSDTLASPVPLYRTKAITLDITTVSPSIDPLVTDPATLPSAAATRQTRQSCVPFFDSSSSASRSYYCFAIACHGDVLVVQARHFDTTAPLTITVKNKLSVHNPASITQVCNDMFPDDPDTLPELFVLIQQSASAQDFEQLIFVVATPSYGFIVVSANVHDDAADLLDFRRWTFLASSVEPPASPHSVIVRSAGYVETATVSARYAAVSACVVSGETAAKVCDFVSLALTTEVVVNGVSVRGLHARDWHLVDSAMASRIVSAHASHNIFAVALHLRDTSKVAVLGCEFVAPLDASSSGNNARGGCSLQAVVNDAHFPDFVQFPVPYLRVVNNSGNPSSSSPWRILAGGDKTSLLAAEVSVELYLLPSSAVKNGIVFNFSAPDPSVSVAASGQWETPSSLVGVVSSRMSSSKDGNSRDQVLLLITFDSKTGLLQAQDLDGSVFPFRTSSSSSTATTTTLDLRLFPDLPLDGARFLGMNLLPDGDGFLIALVGGSAAQQIVLIHAKIDTTTTANGGELKFTTMVAPMPSTFGALSAAWIIPSASGFSVWFYASDTRSFNNIIVSLSSSSLPATIVDVRRTESLPSGFAPAIQLTSAFSPSTVTSTTSLPLAAAGCASSSCSLPELLQSQHDPRRYLPISGATSILAQVQIPLTQFSVGANNVCFSGGVCFEFSSQSQPAPAKHDALVLQPRAWRTPQSAFSWLPDSDIVLPLCRSASNDNSVSVTQLHSPTAPSLSAYVVACFDGEIFYLYLVSKLPLGIKSSVVAALAAPSYRLSVVQLGQLPMQFPVRPTPVVARLVPSPSSSSAAAPRLIVTVENTTTIFSAVLDTALTSIVSHSSMAVDGPVRNSVRVNAESTAATSSPVVLVAGRKICASFDDGAELQCSDDVAVDAAGAFLDPARIVVHTSTRTILVVNSAFSSSPSSSSSWSCGAVASVITFPEVKKSSPPSSITTSTTTTTTTSTTEDIATTTVTANTTTTLMQQQGAFDVAVDVDVTAPTTTAIAEMQSAATATEKPITLSCPLAQQQQQSSCASLAALGDIVSIHVLDSIRSIYVFRQQQGSRVIIASIVSVAVASVPGTEPRILFEALCASAPLQLEWTFEVPSSQATQCNNFLFVSDGSLSNDVVAVGVPSCDLILLDARSGAILRTEHWVFNGNAAAASPLSSPSASLVLAVQSTTSAATTTAIAFVHHAQSALVVVPVAPSLKQQQQKQQGEQASSSYLAYIPLLDNTATGWLQSSSSDSLSSILVFYGSGKPQLSIPLGNVFTVPQWPAASSLSATTLLARSLSVPDSWRLWIPQTQWVGVSGGTAPSSLQLSLSSSASALSQSFTLLLDDLLLTSFASAVTLSALSGIFTAPLITVLPQQLSLTDCGTSAGFAANFVASNEAKIETLTLANLRGVNVSIAANASLAFSRTTSLTLLYVNSVNFTTDDLEHQFTSATQIIISYAGLKATRLPLLNYPRLQVLDLSGNSGLVAPLYTDISSLVSLRQLDLSYTSVFSPASSSLSLHQQRGDTCSDIHGATPAIEKIVLTGCTSISGALLLAHGTASPDEVVPSCIPSSLVLLAVDGTGISVVDIRRTATVSAAPRNSQLEIRAPAPLRFLVCDTQHPPRMASAGAANSSITLHLVTAAPQTDTYVISSCMEAKQQQQQQQEQLFSVIDTADPRNNLAITAMCTEPPATDIPTLSPSTVRGCALQFIPVPLRADDQFIPGDDDDDGDSALLAQLSPSLPSAVVVQGIFANFTDPSSRQQQPELDRICARMPLHMWLFDGANNKGQQHQKLGEQLSLVFPDQIGGVFAPCFVDLIHRSSLGLPEPLIQGTPRVGLSLVPANNSDSSAESSSSSSGILVPGFSVSVTYSYLGHSSGSGDSSSATTNTFTFSLSNRSCNVTQLFQFDSPTSGDDEGWCLQSPPPTFHKLVFRSDSTRALRLHKGTSPSMTTRQLPWPVTVFSNNSIHPLHAFMVHPLAAALPRDDLTSALDYRLQYCSFDPTRPDALRCQATSQSTVYLLRSFCPQIPWFNIVACLPLPLPPPQLDDAIMNPYMHFTGKPLSFDGYAKTVTFEAQVCTDSSDAHTEGITAAKGFLQLGKCSDLSSLFSATQGKLTSAGVGGSNSVQLLASPISTACPRTDSCSIHLSNASRGATNCRRAANKLSDLGFCAAAQGYDITTAGLLFDFIVSSNTTETCTSSADTAYYTSIYRAFYRGVPASQRPAATADSSTASTSSSNAALNGVPYSSGSNQLRVRPIVDPSTREILFLDCSHDDDESSSNRNNSSGIATMSNAVILHVKDNACVSGIKMRVSLCMSFLGASSIHTLSWYFMVLSSFKDIFMMLLGFYLFSIECFRDFSSSVVTRVLISISPFKHDEKKDWRQRFAARINPLRLQNDDALKQNFAEIFDATVCSSKRLPSRLGDDLRASGMEESVERSDDAAGADADYNNAFTPRDAERADLSAVWLPMKGIVDSIATRVADRINEWRGVKERGNHHDYMGSPSDLGSQTELNNNPSISGWTNISDNAMGPSSRHESAADLRRSLRGAGGGDDDSPSSSVASPLLPPPQQQQRQEQPQQQHEDRLTPSAAAAAAEIAPPQIPAPRGQALVRADNNDISELDDDDTSAASVVSANTIERPLLRPTATTPAAPKEKQQQQQQQQKKTAHLGNVQQASTTALLMPSSANFSPTNNLSNNNMSNLNRSTSRLFNFVPSQIDPWVSNRFEYILYCRLCLRNSREIIANPRDPEVIKAYGRLRAAWSYFGGVEELAMSRRSMTKGEQLALREFHRVSTSQDVVLAHELIRMRFTPQSWMLILQIMFSCVFFVAVFVEVMTNRDAGIVTHWQLYERLQFRFINSCTVVSLLCNALLRRYYLGNMRPDAFLVIALLMILPAFFTHILPGLVLYCWLVAAAALLFYVFALAAEVISKVFGDALHSSVVWTLLAVTRIALTLMLTVMIQCLFNYSSLFYSREAMQLSYLEIIGYEWRSRDFKCTFLSLEESLSNVLQAVSTLF